MSSSTPQHDSTPEDLLQGHGFVAADDQPLEAVEADEHLLSDDYDDFDDDWEDEWEEGDGPSKKRRSKNRRIKMHCFHCNRQEGHFLAHRGRWFYSYFQGLTFGFANLFGPFKCQCCGHNRLMCSDYLNPRKLFLPRGKSPTKKKQKQKRKRSR